MNELRLITVLTRSLVVGCFFLLLLMAAGCTGNDRYSFVAPDPPHSDLPVVDGGPLVMDPLPTIAYLEPRAAVYADGTYVALSEGYLVQCSGDRCRVVTSLGRGDTRFLARDRDGLVWTLDHLGEYGTWDGATWESQGVVDAAPFQALGFDGDGRLVILLADARLLRRDQDGWRVVALPYGIAGEAMWSAPGQPLLVVGRFGTEAVLLTLADDAWGVTPLDATASPYAELRLAATDTNNVMVSGLATWDVWMRRDGATLGPVTLPPEGGGSPFWQDGAPWLVAGRIHRYGPAGWEETAQLPTYGRVLGEDAGATVLGSSDGWVATWDGVQLVERFPAVGRAAGVAEDAQGRVLALTERGVLVVREDADWRRLAAGEVAGATHAEALVRDDRGVLVALIDERMWEFDGTAFRPLDLGFETDEATGQPDGRVVLAGPGGYHVWEQGHARFLAGPEVVREYGLPQVAVHDGMLHFLTEDALLRVEDGVAVPLLAFPGDEAHRLAADPQLGILAAGSTVVAWNDGAPEDWGPWGNRISEIYGMIGDGRGGLLAYDSRLDRLLHRINGGWVVYEPPGEVPWLPTGMLRRDGSFLFWNSRRIWTFDPVRGR